MLMWEEAAIKDDVIEYDIAFNIIYIMRTHIAVAKLRCPSLTKIDQGAIVDNKRLGRTLEFIKLVQDKRDNNRSQALPAGDGPSRRRRKPTEKKSQRSLDEDDMLNALKTLQSRSDEIFGTRK